MMYDYIERAYGLRVRQGMRVRLEGTQRFGTVIEEAPSHGHYVQVRFDGERQPGLCHPNSLEYRPTEPGRERA